VPRVRGEARLERIVTGPAPVTDGWFVVDARRRAYGHRRNDGASPL
jgi:hypothetical protein